MQAGRLAPGQPKEPAHALALVLGATGGVGGEVARQLLAAGWRVRAMTRSPPPDAACGEMEWVAGDAMRASDVMNAARGCAVIVHAVNPPGYRRWSELVLPMLNNTVAAACATGATVVLPGTVYNYGPAAFPVLAEDSPQQPMTRKGAIRAEMERRLRAATAHGARVIIVRAGDFFGPKAGNNWFSQGLVKPGRPVGRVRYPGQRGVGHQWAYLPDVARTMVALLARRDALAPFATFHMAGHWDGDGTAMVDTIRGVVAQRTGRTPATAAFPWLLLTLAAPLVATFREMAEMRYLWRQPLRMTGEKLALLLGQEPHTPWDEAVEATLAGLGCIAPAQPNAQSCHKREVSNV
jgi:nucleoside-diphosphate-sugar epimerase